MAEIDLARGILWDNVDMYDGILKANIDYIFGGIFAPAAGGGDIGVCYAGRTSGAARSNVIDYITISSAGNATDFGDASAKRDRHATNDNGPGNRGIMAGGYINANTNVVEYITISTPGNGTDFGDLTVARRGLGMSTSNKTSERMTMNGGWTSAKQTTIDYITISSTGDATDFGDLVSSNSQVAGCSNGETDRGVIIGRYQWLNVIEYITISSVGNSLDFGDTAAGVSYNGGMSNGTNDRGLSGSGFRSGDNDTNVIEYITISTTGNASDFGDLNSAGGLYIAGNQTSNGVNERGIWFGGYSGSILNTIRYTTISTPGNAQDFGDLTEVKSHTGGCSNAATT